MNSALECSAEGLDQYEHLLCASIPSRWSRLRGFHHGNPSFRAPHRLSTFIKLRRVSRTSIFSTAIIMGSTFFSLPRLVLLPNVLLLALSDLVFAKQACLPPQPHTYGFVHAQPVSINTDALFNTTFSPFQGITITVSNAPTSLGGSSDFYVD